MCRDSFIAPGDVAIQFRPPQLRPLQRDTRQPGQLVARVIQYIVGPAKLISAQID
jgi:hypothetical protein